MLLCRCDVTLSCGHPCAVSCSNIRFRPGMGDHAEYGVVVFLSRYRKSCVLCFPTYLCLCTVCVCRESVDILTALSLIGWAVLCSSQLTFRVVVDFPPIILSVSFLQVLVCQTCGCRLLCDMSFCISFIIFFKMYIRLLYHFILF